MIKTDNMKMLTTTRVLSGLLALLGFSACSDENGDEIRSEYGSPIVDYQVKGQVTDAEGNPIEGIQVIAKPTYGVYTDATNSSWKNADTTYTDAEGNFESSLLQNVAMEGKLLFEDVDGEANGGVFQTDSASLQEAETVQLEERDGWYMGRYELTLNKQLAKEEPKQD